MSRPVSKQCSRLALAVALALAPCVASAGSPPTEPRGGASAPAEPSPPMGSALAGGPGAEAVPFVPLYWDRATRPQKPASEVTAIRFLTSGDFPPLSFLDGNGRLMGYQVDLARMLCDELNATCSIQMRPFDDLAAALGDKRGDAIIAGLVVTPAMRDRLETTDAYLGTPGRFVTQRDAGLTATPEGLVGHWVSVVSGSVHEAFILDNFPKTRLAAFPDEIAARDALRDGRVEAHFGDAMGLSYWLDGVTSRGCCAFRDGPWLESAYFGEGLRIAVGKGNGRLRQNLDYALRRLAVEGKLGELYLRWFPRGYY